MQIPIHIVLISPPPGIAFGVQKGSGSQFSGAYLEGKPGEKFVYIDIGTLAGQAGPWSRRLKVQTAKDGGPNCASVKPEQVDTCV